MMFTTLDNTISLFRTFIGIVRSLWATSHFQKLVYKKEIL